MINFINEHPFLTFFIVMGALETLFRLGNRVIRLINVTINGWPPEHLDADGDVVVTYNEDEESDEVVEMLDRWKDGIFTSTYSNGQPSGYIVSLEQMEDLYERGRMLS